MPLQELKKILENGSVDQVGTGLTGLHRLHRGVASIKTSRNSTISKPYPWYRSLHVKSCFNPIVNPQCFSGTSITSQFHILQIFLQLSGSCPLGEALHGRRSEEILKAWGGNPLVPMKIADI